MEALRDLMRRSLARSLHELPAEDRLHTAWPLVCGSALAPHGEVLQLDSEGILHVRVQDSTWRERFIEMRARIAADLGRIAGVPLAGIHFERPTPRMDKGSTAGQQSSEHTASAAGRPRMSSAHNTVSRRRGTKEQGT